MRLVADGPADGTGYVVCSELEFDTVSERDGTITVNFQSDVAAYYENCTLALEDHA